ncbi:MAG: hypothetical protein ACLR7D_12680 [Lachnospira eligens]
MKAVRTGLGLRQEDILIPFSSQTKQGLKNYGSLPDSICTATGKKRQII